MMLRGDCGEPLYSLAWMREWYVEQGAYVVAFVQFLLALVETP